MSKTRKSIFLLAIIVLVIVSVVAAVTCAHADANNKVNDNVSSDSFIWSCIKTFAIAMVPIIELRAAIPIALEHYGLSLPVAFLTAYLGNIVLIPFIILFTRRIIDWVKEKIPFLSKIVVKFEDRLKAKGEKVRKYETFGLLLFVAIPIPGTGAWTGSMIAGLLDMRIKSAAPIISLGVLIAGIIVTIVTYGVDWIVGIFV